MLRFQKNVAATVIIRFLPPHSKERQFGTKVLTLTNVSNKFKSMFSVYFATSCVNVFMLIFICLKPALLTA
jgi:hypothetical protein